MAFRNIRSAVIAASIIALSVLLTGCGSSEGGTGSSSAKINSNGAAAYEEPAFQTPDSSSEYSMIGKWYCEKEDLLFDMQSGGKLAVTEHGESFEQTWETVNSAVIEGLSTGVPSGYDGIFVHYFATGEPDCFAYRFEGADTLIMAHMRAVPSEDLPDAPNDHVKVGSDRTFKRQ